MTILELKRVIANFNKCAHQYDQYAFLQNEIADRLVDRLEIVRLNPERILDIGARAGYSSQLLRKRYPQAQVISLDWAQNFVKIALNSQTIGICAQPENVPIAPRSVDLICANLTWHWLNNPIQALKEWRRLLKPGGLLMFSTCGPDTFYELRASFAAVDELPHVHLFLDMHDIGDALVAAQYIDPVMQAEKIYLNYSSLTSLWRDLRKTGVSNALADRRRTLTGKNRWRRMLIEYEKKGSAQEGWPATIEVIYGLGWAEDSPFAQQNEVGEIAIPIEHIRRKTHE